jgi:hypothetical protein
MRPDAVLTLLRISECDLVCGYPRDESVVKACMTPL